MAPNPESEDYQVSTPELLRAEPLDGWREVSVARLQHAAYQGLLRQMYQGHPREDFLAVAAAVRHTGTIDGALLEVGCGSGYYSEVLSHLLAHPLRYIGLDYSEAMLRTAISQYPDLHLVVGDATALPFGSGAIDIVLSGGSLMHTLGYERAITEMRRVSRAWCILHTVPVLERRETTVLRKRAYGQPTVEVVFNERALLSLLQENGLQLAQVLDSIPYDLQAVLGEPTVTKTYVCEVGGA